MAKKRHTPEQVINKLREAEVAIAEGSTAVRAHMCAAGGSKKGGASTNRAWVDAGVASAARSISSSMRLASLYSSS